MPTNGGWTGKTLHVNLTTGAITAEDTITKYGDYWGGTAMAYKVLWDQPASAGPWDPENHVIFGWGPLAGTGAPCAGRTSVTSLWPGHPDNAVATGHMGGHFSAEAKFAGWDGIIVEGKAPGPVYIAIRDDDVKIVDCPEIWGQGIYFTTQAICLAMGKSAQVAAIGQAGENLVIHSNVMTGVSHSAGVCGSVMGSKNLKAIGVIGTGGIKIAATKKSWSNLVDNGLALIGSTYQHVIPEVPQPWAEYYASGSWWKGAPKRYWGAATPPVEMGITAPEDRDKIAFRTLIPTRYMTALGDEYCVRMDGCFGCPLRCHIASHVPSAERWGTDANVQNTCTGMFLANFIPAGNYTGAAPLGALEPGEAKIRQVEARNVGIHVGDDLGIWTHYSQMSSHFSWMMSTDFGVNRIKPNLPAAEWTDINKAGGMIDMWKKADLNFMKEFGRRVAYKVGELGRAFGDGVMAHIEAWHDASGNVLKTAYMQQQAVWVHGGPGHHHSTIPESLQVGYLYNTTMNRDPMNHSWSNWVGGGLPTWLMKNIVEQSMKPTYGPGMGAAIDTSGAAYPPMNVARAKVTKLAVNRTELHNMLGICDWSYPWWSSPLKSRGYVGDLAMEVKYFNAATGRSLTMAQLDREAERSMALHRALTMRAFGSKDMRTLHDQLPPWTAMPAALAADWSHVLDMWYAELGYDQATGAPTAATLDALGMTDIKNALAALGLMP